MHIIRPVQIDTAHITSTNAVPLNSAWSSGTSYTIGQLSEKSYRVYESIAAGTNLNNDPDTDTNNGTIIGTYWQYIEATNSRIMFDYTRSGDDYQTVNASNINVTLEPNQGVTDTIAFFGLAGSYVAVTITDAIDGIVYQEEFELADNSAVYDGYTYCFEPIVRHTELIVDDLPAYGNTEILVVITAGSDDAKCGKCVVGFRKFIGDVVFGTQVGIVSYSSVEREFGRAVIKSGDYNRFVDYKIGVNTPYNREVQKLLTGFRDKPIVFIGASDDFLETTLYGVYKDFTLSLDNLAISSLSMRVEEL
jgi:hypothetical protein